MYEQNATVTLIFPHTGIATQGHFLRIIIQCNLPVYLLFNEQTMCWYLQSPGDVLLKSLFPIRAFSLTESCYTAFQSVREKEIIHLKKHQFEFYKKKHTAPLLLFYLEFFVVKIAVHFSSPCIDFELSWFFTWLCKWGFVFRPICKRWFPNLQHPFQHVNGPPSRLLELLTSSHSPRELDFSTYYSPCVLSSILICSCKCRTVLF